jgi:subtilisin family serine protease
MKKFILIFATVIQCILSNTNAQSYTIGDFNLILINDNYYAIFGSDTALVNDRAITVKFIEGYRQVDRDAFENEFDLTLFEEVVTGYIDYILPLNEDYIEICNDIIIQEIVENFSIGIYIETCFVPNDSDLLEQWYLENIDAYGAWDLTKGKKDVIIAVLDTGVDWDDEELGPVYDINENIFHNPGEDAWQPWNNPEGGNNIDGPDNYTFIDDWKGWDYTSQFAVNWDNDTRHDLNDTYRHGSRVAGIICAKTNNNYDIAGIAGGNIENEEEGISCLPVKLGYDHYIELLTLDNAILYAKEMGADIINLSIGWEDWGGIPPSLFEPVNEALALAYNEGAFIAGSAGNTGEDIIWPALNDHVFAVSASNQNNQLWEYSSYGDGLEMAAPGENIWSIDDLSGSGTSYSCAMVSATAALMLSVNPELTNVGIWNILIKTAEKVGGYNYQGEPDSWCMEFGYGRLNVCKAVSMAMQYNEPEIISSTTEWNEVKMFNNDVIIEPQCTLTVKNTVYMGTYIDAGGEVQKAKIIVKSGIDNPGTTTDKSGATLIVDGGKLTNHNTCGEDMGLWAGVEVWGLKNRSQYREDGFYYQGKIILKNRAIIENAEKGVLLGNKTGIDEYGHDVYNFDKAGGIIQVDNNGNPELQTCTFLNDSTGIYFLPYKNYIPNTNPKKTCDNLSYLNNCLFNINTDYVGGGWWYEHIFGWEVTGIKIKGCTFENNKTTSHGGHGINGYNAGFIIESICNSIVQPCPGENTDSCKFIKFSKAINLVNGQANIKNTKFIDNSNGIVLNNVNNAVILFNTFEVGLRMPTGCAASYGIDMTNCKGFAIEENEFSKFQGAPIDTYVGIRVNNCHSVHDIIYKNEFIGLSYGNYAQGINRSDPNDDQKGVEYQCNINTGNSVDFIVTADLPQSAKIRTDQGSPNLASGNTFSSSAAWHYRNEGLEKIDYYFWNGNQLEIPDMQRVYSIDGLYFDDHEANQNTCPSHYGGGGGGTGGRTLLTDEEKLEREQSYYQNLSDYHNVKALFDNLKDGGNTEALQAEVETSWPGDMWELRADLLGKSPHLSKEVLMTAADKTDVLPESVLFEILSANPDELKEADLIKYLEDKEQPLPQYMIDILQQLSFGVTYKTILKRQMAGYHAGKTQAVFDIIRSILADTITDMQQYRNWLDNLGGIEADKQIIASYLSEGNFADAQSLLNLLPSLYEFDEQALNDFNDYKSLVQLQMTLEQQGRNIFELDTAEVNLLKDYAENSAGEAKYMAQGILNFAYGFNYCDCIVNSDSSFMKSSKAFPSKSFDTMFGSEITVKPNPAGEWTTFNYKLPGNSSEGLIEITDVSGAEIERFTVTGTVGQKIWDTRKIKSGVYFYTLNVSGNNKSGEIVICK